MRSVDDIAADYVHARTDQERARLIREMEAANASIAAAHLQAGHIAEYEQITRAHYRVLSDATLRTLGRMGRGEL
jgi:hypothetical protein